MPASTTGQTRPGMPRVIRNKTASVATTISTLSIAPTLPVQDRREMARPGRLWKGRRGMPCPESEQEIGRRQCQRQAIAVGHRDLITGRSGLTWRYHLGFSGLRLPYRAVVR